MSKRLDLVQRCPSTFRVLVNLAKRPPASNAIADTQAAIDHLNAINRLTCGFHPLRCKFALVRKAARETMHQRAMENSELQAATMLDLGEKGFEHYDYVKCNEEYPLRWHKPYLLFVQNNGLCQLLEESRYFPQYTIPTGYNVMTGTGWWRRRIPASTITIHCTERDGFAFEPYSGPSESSIKDFLIEDGFAFEPYSGPSGSSIKDLLIEGGALVLAEDLYLFEYTPQLRTQHQSPTQTTVAYTEDEGLYALFHDVPFQGQHIDRIIKGGFQVVELFEKPLGWTDGIPKRLKTSLAMRVTDGSRHGAIWKSSSESDFQFEWEDE